MKLRVDRPAGQVLVGLALLAGITGAATPGWARDPALPLQTTGPAADYPIVLGPPLTIDGVTYTPVDKMNLDEVGYAVVDPAAGPTVSIAHRTLPLPSYAEVTSLRTGRTILVRVERRGPPSGTAAVALSPAAAAQLGLTEARTPIRIRRVNPPEPERALLRAGQPAPARMDTPMSLVAVLMRKLDPTAPVPQAQPAASQPAVALPAVSAPTPPASRPAAPPPAPAVTPKKPAVMPVQLRPVAVAPIPEPVAPASTPKPVPPKPSPAVAADATVVQVGAFSSRASADRVAARVGGTVSAAGKLFRVRIGGLATPQAAAAALAKARAAGYSEARIQHAD